MISKIPEELPSSLRSQSQENLLTIVSGRIRYQRCPPGADSNNLRWERRSVINTDMLAEAALWVVLAAFAWNFQGLVARFPAFFLGMQTNNVALPTRYARLLLAVLAGWEISINAGNNWLPPVCFLIIVGYLLAFGWQAEGEEHLRWLGLFGTLTAVILCWMSLGG